MSDPGLHRIEVSAESFYIEAQSNPEADRYVFAYTITIRNIGRVAAQLLTRHWVITDSHGEVEEVRGDGVVGEQPHLSPGEMFRYTSGAIIETPVGTMHGSYQMVADDGLRFDAEIPEFALLAPRTRARPACTSPRSPAVARRAGPPEPGARAPERGGWPRPMRAPFRTAG